MRRVYLAGALDYANLDPARHKTDDWQHGEWQRGLSGVVFFCPYCEAKEKITPFDRQSLKPDWLIMQQNTIALATADAVVAVFDVAVPTFGTPIEIHERVRRAPGSVFLVHIGKPGLFVREMGKHGEVVFGSLEDAREWLISYLNLPSPSQSPINA